MNLAKKAEHHTIYRNIITAKGLIPFSLVIKETDLLILAETQLRKEAKKAVIQYRYQIEEYIRRFPDFLHSLSPLPLDDSAPSIVKEMMYAAILAEVGPMASVAGAIAEKVGNELLTHTPQIVIENGGDIFLKVSKDLIIGIYAGNSPLSNKIGLKIASDLTPLGVCTSSGTVGHSLSFGKSDAVTVIAKSTPLADAAATAIGNLVKVKKDIERGLKYAQTIKGIYGTLIIVDDQFGAWGNIEIISI